MTAKKILIAGAHGMVGRALTRVFQKKEELLTPSRRELDLTEQKEVREYLREHQPDAIVIAAAKVGGIFANSTFPAEFLYDNLLIATHLIHEAHKQGIDRLLFLGSSCIYPKFAEQPIKEESLLTGPLEPTNEAYALAKIAGVKLCEFYSTQYGRKYFALMPTNLYGPGDNYHPTHSHVIPGLIRRFHDAKIKGDAEVEVWGSGKALREFLFVDDLAEAAYFLIEHYQGPHINCGSGEEITTGDLAKLIAQVVGYQGLITQDPSKPDGTPRKLLDSRKIHALGWRAKTSLLVGLPIAYADFCQQRRCIPI